MLWSKGLPHTFVKILKQYKPMRYVKFRTFKECVVLDA